MYFAAITAWKPESGDWIIPNLFFWSGNVERFENLKGKLILERPTTPFGGKFKKIIAKSSAKHPQFDVFEDRSTSPGEARVFISLARSPYLNFVTPDMLEKSTTILALKAVGRLG